MANDIKENILSGRAWLRILLMLIYAIFAWVVGFVIIFLMIVQAVCNVLFGENNQQVKEVSSAAVDYFSEILAFMTYCSDNKPAPFSSFNDIEEESEGASDAGVQPTPNIDNIVEEHTENNAPDAESDFEDDVFADISFTAQDTDEPDQDEPKEESDEDKKPQGSV